MMYRYFLGSIVVTLLYTCCFCLVKDAESRDWRMLVSVVRFYGELIPKPKKFHLDNFTYNYDIIFSKSNDL